MYKIFKRIDLAEYGGPEPDFVWRLIGDFSNSEDAVSFGSKLETGDYMIVKDPSFIHVAYKKSESSWNNSPIPTPTTLPEPPDEFEPPPDSPLLRMFKGGKIVRERGGK